MKRFCIALAVLCACTALAVHAQQSSENCQAGSLDLSSSGDTEQTTRPTNAPDVTTSRPAVAVEPSTDAEQYVQNVIEKDGLHVVHFWAPWCANSRQELKNGWSSLVSNNPEVTFTFVTVWNDGETGTDFLDEYDLANRVTEVTQPDLGPSDQDSNRRRSFLTHPVTWIPSTWIFHNNGELAFALNYGEMDRSILQSLIDVTRKEW